MPTDIRQGVEVTVELRMLLAGVRRFGLLVVLFAALGLAVSTIVLGDDEPAARARTTVALDPNGGRAPGSPSFIGDPDRYVEGELSILGSRSIAAAAAERVPGATAAEIEGSLDLTQRAGSSVIDITASAGSTADARAIVDAVAGVYLERRVLQVTDEVQRRRDAVDAELAQVQQELEAVQGRLVGPTPPPVDVIRRETLLRRYDQLLDIRSGLLESSLPADGTRVIEPAVDVTGGDGISSLLVPMVGLLGGGAVGATLALGLVAASPRVADRQHAEEIVGLPAVLDIGLRTRVTKPSRVPPETVAAVHRLAAVIAAQPAARLPRTIAVCSPVSTREASTVAAALTAALVAERFHVAHLSLGPAGSTDRAGELPPDPSGDLEDWDLRRASPLLDLVRPRWGVEQPVDAEKVENLRKLLDARADVIVIDLPGLVESASSVSVAHTVDDVALVATLPQTEPELVLARRVLLEVPTSRVHLVIARPRGSGGNVLYRVRR